MSVAGSVTGGLKGVAASTLSYYLWSGGRKGVLRYCAQSDLVQGFPGFLDRTLVTLGTLRFS